MEPGSLDKEPMDTAVLQVVIEEFSEKQEAGNQQLTQLLKEVSTLNDQLQEIKEAQQKQPVVHTDYTPVIRKAIEESFREQQNTGAADPVKAVKEYRILLFPEQDRKLFYKIVFGRWLLYLVIMLLLNSIYKYAIRRSDNTKELQIEQSKNDQISQSWQYLYNHGSKSTKRIMEDAYRESGTTAGR